MSGLLVLAGGVALLADTTPPQPMDGNVALDLTTPGTPFAASSFWNTPVPANVPLNPNSADYANEISNQVCYGWATFSTAPTNCPTTNSNTSALNTSKWSAPLYVVPPDQPLVPVTNVCSTHAAFNASVAGGVPIPADAHGSGGAYQPDAPTTTPHGTAGTTISYYLVVAVTSNGSSSEPSSTGYTDNGNATLSATNYNTLTWAPVTGATQYQIYRNYSNGTPSSQGLIGTVSAEGGNNVPQTFNDTGFAATTAAPPSGDTDEEVIIYQPSTDKEWEFWHFQKDSSNNWTACWGGGMSNVSQSNGIFPNNLGATATSLPLLGGIPRISEFQAGAINHVINLSLGENFYRTGLPGNTSSPLTCAVTPPTCTGPANVTDPGNKAYSWPATRNDGQNPSTLAIPEGTRLRLNPNLDLSTLNLSPVAMTIAVAAQKYGFVVVDSSRSVSIRMPDPTTYTVAGLPNPYTAGPGVGGVGNQGLYEGASPGSIMKNFPWSQLQALPFNYGEPGVTPPGDTTPPSQPTGVSATAPNSGTVNLKWTASTDNVGVTGYKIYRDNGTTAAASVSGSTTTYTDTDVLPGTTYSYTVTAVDAAVNASPNSASASATTGYPMDGAVNLSLPSSGTPFAASSFWNTALPGNTPVNTNNTAYISNIETDLGYVAGHAGLGNITQPTNGYSAPLYVVPANQPNVSVTRVCNGTVSPNGAFDASMVGGVPVPADAHAATGTDGEIQIYQPSTDKYWDFWRFAKDTTTGGWEACWGGPIAGGTMNIGGRTVTEPTVSQSNGIFPDNLGAVATSLPLLGGVVRIEELQKGEIDHVMGLELANNQCPYVEPKGATSCTYPKQAPFYNTSATSWPASRSDGTSLNALATPEGLRFRLPASFNLSAYIAQLPKGQTLSPIAQTIAVAAQKYGFVVYDTTPGVALRAGDPAPYVAAGLGNPYTSGPGVGGVSDGNQGLIAGGSSYNIMLNFPWSQLQALPANYGQPIVDTTPPSVPANLHSTSWTTTSISLAWNASTDNSGGSGVAGYHVYRDGKLIASPAGTSYTDSAGLNPSTTYSYNVSAYDKAANGSDATATLALKPSTGPPVDGNVQLSLPTPGAPFAASSFWNTLLPSNTPLNTNNSAYINDIQYDLQHYYGTPQKPNNGSLNASKYSSPLYVVPANQPYVSVKPYCSNGQPVYQDYVDAVLAGGVPIPADAHAAAGTDEAIQIYQPSTNKYWDFWRLQKDSSGNWEACWGGRIDNASQSDGIFSGNFGASATGLPLVGGVIRIEELQAGQINHVMALSLVTRLDRHTLPANTPGATVGFSWPARRSDGSSTSPTAVPEGTHLRIPAGMDLSNYNPANPAATDKLSPTAYTILVAAQKYGFVVRDGAGAVSIDLGDPTPYTSIGLADPYSNGPGVGGVGSNGLFDDTQNYLVMKGFPWDKLQALPYNYGQPSPDTTPPSVPTNLNSTSPTTTSVALTWNASTDNTGGSGLAGYHVYRNNVLIASPTGTSYSDTGLTPNTSYTYSVSAYDNAGNGSVASSASTTLTTGQPMDGNVALSLPSSGTPFAANSFWNTPLAASTPLNTNNAAYQNVLAYNLCHDYPVAQTPPSSCSTPTYGGSLATTAWSAPLYVVPANQPYVPVQPYCVSGAATAPAFASMLSGGVPIPADAHAAAGSDAEIQIYQPSTGKYWDFWQFQKSSGGGWQACFGGLINNVSQSNGIVPSGLGALSTGLPLLGGVVRIDELQAGQINHAIGLELPDMLSKNVIPANTPNATKGISWPATRSDGVNTNPLAVPEGTRFRLPANLDLSQYNLSPIAKAIAVAAQKYGFVLFEQTGNTTGNVQIDLGDSTTYTTAGLPNPYTTGAGVGGVGDGNTGLFDGAPFGSISGTQVMSNFPWSQLQALPFSYGGPDTTPPSTPGSVSASAANSAQINLSWAASTDNVGVTGYKIYRNGSSTALATVAAAATSYQDDAVSANTHYTYQVTALDAAGNQSATGATAGVTTPPTLDKTPPSVPTGLKRTGATTTTITLAWNASTDNAGGSGLAGYHVYRNNVLIASPSTTSYTDSGLTAGTYYTYSVGAYDLAANGSVGSATLITTPILPPSQPTSLHSTAITTTSIAISWNASTDTNGAGLAGYHVYRNGTLIASPAGTSYTDSGLSPGTNYSYSVSAYDDAANGSIASGALSLETTLPPPPPDTTPPSTPGNLTATAANSAQVNLSWAASTDNVKVTAYKIYRNGSGTALATVTAPTVSYQDATVSAGTTYTYQMAAVDAAGNQSARSSVITAITPTATDTIPPSTPTGLKRTKSTTASITLSWNASTDSGGSRLAGYHVYRNNVLIASPSGTSYTDIGLPADTTYSYTVSAYDHAANGSAAASPLVVGTFAQVLGDFGGDGIVNILDLSILLSHYGLNYTPAEFDHHSTVDLQDLSVLLSNYGK